MLDSLKRLVPNRIRRSYAAKFAIVVIVIGLSIGLIGGAATAVISDEIEQSVSSDHATIASNDADSVERWQTAKANNIKILSRQDQLRADTGNETEISNLIDYLERYSSENDETSTHLEAIHVVNRNSGDVVTSTNVSLRGETVSNENHPWVDATAFDTQGVHVTTAYPGGDTYFITLATPVDGNDDRLVAMSFNAQEVGESILSGASRQLNNPNVDSSFSTVVDSDGNVVMHDRDGGSLVGEQYPTSSRSFEMAQDAVSPQTMVTGSTAGIIDERHVVGAQKIGGQTSSIGTDWYVMVHTPSDEAFGFVSTVRQYGIGATLGGVLLIGLIGAILGRNTAVAIDRLTSKTEEMESGNLDVDFETSRIDNIGRLYDGFANMRDALREQIREAQQAREEAEQARAETEQMNEHLETKADDYQQVMEAAAEGDMTARMDPESDNESMTQIGRTFNEMLGEIEATTEQLKNFAAEVATASEQVTASSEEVRSASEQVTESIQEISDGAERQNDSLQSVSQEMSGLSTTIEEIASSSNEVADIAERTANTGREGREAAQQAIEGMNSIEAESEEAVEEIEQLQEEVAQIDDLLEFITEVAEQTNMLALNANIEASRSGESGEGFAVVAEEVKELAADTKEAAEDIEDRLEQIKAQTDTTAEEVRKTSNEVSQHTDSVREAADALEEIAGYAQETNTGVQEISAATQQQAASTQQVVAMVDEAATISEETTAEAENVAAAAEEQTTALTEVSRSASDLANQASQLSEALDRFDTDADREPGQSELPDGQDNALPSAEELAADLGGEPDDADTSEEGAEPDATPEEEANEATFDDPLGNADSQTQPETDSVQSRESDTAPASDDADPATLNRTEPVDDSNESVASDDVVDAGASVSDSGGDQPTDTTAQDHTDTTAQETEATALGGSTDDAAEPDDAEDAADADSAAAPMGAADEPADAGDDQSTSPFDSDPLGGTDAAEDQGAPVAGDDGEQAGNDESAADAEAPDPLGDIESDDSTESITLGSEADAADDDDSVDAEADADAAEADEQSEDSEADDETNDDDMFSFVQSEPENRDDEN
ncbi:methyl-accepting chemotaxis protein [Natronoarchaeum philippinense]|uniref:Methyl-accepting chemotaxis protein n=1 Tax=Natronoarchaeum philippinense TaxID=558529 RepID=A0A285NSJ4_NATPI|nr:methyl-accepting chemotaxis protein [Natronoarchaeum philippinense]SNZ12480.1 methyl-accepting chemotaxis protein [Natronoarchaeum philippinense]